MINISQNTLEALQTPVKLRESVKLTSSLVSFAKEIKKVELNKEGMINRSNLSQLKVTLHGEHDLQGQYFDFERSFTTLDNIVHVIPYGQYRVIKQEYKDNDKTTDLELYDNMIKTQVEYKKEDINVTFPITLLNMFKKVASTVGLQTDVTTFPLSNETIKLDVWSNTSYTYRDVLDHIAEISVNTIYIKDNKLFITGGQTTGVTIDYKRSKALKVSEKVGKFNLLNLTREPQHDNYAYPTNWASIPIDDRKEYVIQNNAIIDNDREVWAPKIFNNIKDLEYTPFEADTFGWGIFDIGDKVTVKDLNGKTYQSIITSEINSYNGMWTTKLESKKLSNAKDKYVVITDRRRQGQTVYFLVDQQNGVIEGIINNVTQLGETTTQLRLDLESLLLRVNSVGNPNIIYNLNGESDYDGWSFPVSLPLKFKQRLRFFSSMRWSNNFVPSVDNSLSGNKITFVNKGESLSSKGRVIKGDKYSYRGVRVGNESRFKIYVREYTSMDNETTFTDSLLLDTIQPKKVEVASIDLKATTVAVRLRFVTEVGLALTDQMFNRGEPREWELSAEDVKVWAESQILIRDNTIALQAQEIDNLNNDIHNAGIEINAVDGITTWGSVLNFMNSSKTKSLLKIVTKEGEEHLEIDLSNSSVGNFTMDNGAMVLTTPPYERMYSESDLSVIKNILATSKTPTPYEMYLYDVNKDGKISLIDLALVKSHLMNVTPITVFPIIQSRIIVGNNNGEFLAQALFNNGNVGAQTKIRDNRVETSNLSVDGISFGGKSVEVDTNGFLKVV